MRLLPILALCVLAVGATAGCGHTSSNRAVQLRNQNAVRTPVNTNTTRTNTNRNTGHNPAYQR